MGTAVPAVGMLVNRGGYNPEVRVRGGCAAHTWRAGRGTGAESGRRTDALNGLKTIGGLPILLTDYQPGITRQRRSQRHPHQLH